MGYNLLKSSASLIELVLFELPLFDGEGLMEVMFKETNADERVCE